MDLSALTNLSPASLTTPQAAKASNRVSSAAQQFEALLIGEMLKSTRESSEDGWMGGGSDSGAESAFGMAETQFAQAIASRGGLGLAKTIEHALAPVENAQQSQPASPGTSAATPKT